MIAKRELFEFLSAREDCVSVAFSPLAVGTVVPDELAGSQGVVFDFSLGRYAQGSLGVSDAGLAATFSFSGRSFDVFVPWSGVFSIFVREKMQAVWDLDPGALRGPLERPPEAAKARHLRSV